MPAQTDMAPARVVGRYALYDEIASGGMATVHLGRLRGAVGFARTVAVKCLYPQFARDSEFVSMFVDEARLAARIRHPNVAQTIDVVTADGELFLVMEYIHGESLTRLMRLSRAQRKPVPHRVAAAVMVGALLGLHAAHDTKDEHGQSLEIVHRDVSPQNILVGSDGLARVIDFGIARASGRVHTSQVGKIKGKLAYMSPEQVQSGVVTRQADIYAASVVLWELLTGKRLFQSETQAALIARVLAGDVERPSRVARGVPEAYDEVVMKGLAPSPERRYASAKEMARALEACQGVESLGEVANWVESTAGEELRARAERVASIERNTEVTQIHELRAMVDELAAGKSHHTSVAPPLPDAALAAPTASGVGAVAHTHLSTVEPANGRERRLLWAGIAVAALGIGSAVAAISMAPTNLFGSAAKVSETAALDTRPSSAPGATAAPAPVTAEPEPAAPVAAPSALPEPAPSASTANAVPSAAPPRRAAGPRKTDSKSSKSPFKGLGGRL